MVLTDYSMKESPAFRAGRMCAPSMGTILEVQVLP